MGCGEEEGVSLSCGRECPGLRVGEGRAYVLSTSEGVGTVAGRGGLRAGRDGRRQRPTRVWSTFLGQPHARRLSAPSRHGQPSPVRLGGQGVSAGPPLQQACLYCADKASNPDALSVWTGRAWSGRHLDARASVREALFFFSLPTKTRRWHGHAGRLNRRHAAHKQARHPPARARRRAGNLRAVQPPGAHIHGRSRHVTHARAPRHARMRRRKTRRATHSPCCPRSTAVPGGPRAPAPGTGRPATAPATAPCRAGLPRRTSARPAASRAAGGDERRVARGGGPGLAGAGRPRRGRPGGGRRARPSCGSRANVFCFFFLVFGVTQRVQTEIVSRVRA
jgi:hypothetical protein